MIKGMFVFGCGMAVGTIYGTLLGFKIAEDAREKELIRAGAAFEKAKQAGSDVVDAAKDVGQNVKATVDPTVEVPTAKPAKKKN